MSKRTIVGALSALTLVGAGLAAVAAVPAVAGGDHELKCDQVTHTNYDGVSVEQGATRALTADGIRVKVPQQNSRARWSSAPVKVALSAVTALTYRTFREPGGTNAAALPAYWLALDVTGDGVEDSRLIYEPYFQGAGNPVSGAWKPWDVKAGEFWATRTIPGLSNPDSTGSTSGSYDGNRTWAQIVAANPTAKVVGYGWQLGTYNHVTDATVNDLVFAQRGACSKHTWVDPKTRPQAAFVDYCDGTTKVVVTNRSDKNWTVAIDRKGDDVPPKTINVDAGQSGTYVVGAGQGPIEVWAWTHGRDKLYTEETAKGGHGREGWIQVATHTWKRPAKCVATVAASSTCDELVIVLKNPPLAPAVDAILTPSPDGAEKLTLTLKPGEDHTVKYDGAKDLSVRVVIGGAPAKTFTWSRPSGCPAVPGNPGATPSASPVPGGGLPVTGTPVGYHAGIGAGAVLLGAALIVGLWWTGRRRRAVTALPADEYAS